MNALTEADESKDSERSIRPDRFRVELNSLPVAIRPSEKYQEREARERPSQVVSRAGPLYRPLPPARVVVIASVGQRLKQAKHPMQRSEKTG